MAERARFELAVSCPTLVFKTSTLNHSVTSPGFIILTEVSTIFQGDYAVRQPTSAQRHGLPDDLWERGAQLVIPYLKRIKVA